MSNSNDGFRYSQEGPAYTKEEIDAKMAQIRRNDIEKRSHENYDADVYGRGGSTERIPAPSLKTKRPFGSKVKTAFKKGAVGVGSYTKKKIVESRDVDTQIKKTTKKAQLAEAKNRLARAEGKLRKNQRSGGGVFGGSMFDSGDTLFGGESSNNHGSNNNTGLNFGLDAFGSTQPKKNRRKNGDPFNLNMDFGI